MKSRTPWERSGSGFEWNERAFGSTLWKFALGKLCADSEIIPILLGDKSSLRQPCVLVFNEVFKTLRLF